MRIRILLFARLRDIVGREVLERHVEEGATLQGVWAALAGEFPELARYTSSISGAVNEEYARMSAPVREGDEVAFLPPVSGGSRELAGR
jgi:molybdopterin converting factor subunit 1